MKRTCYCLIVVALLTAAASDAFAFDACNAVTDPASLNRELRDVATKRTPVRYHDLAQTIQLITTDAGDRLIPLAGQQQQIKFILFPSMFVKAMCQIALATYLNIEGVQPEIFDKAAATAARCVDAGGTQKTCLVGFGDELDRRYGGAFGSLPSGHSQTAYGIYQAALHQMLMHEYGHHFLGHLERIGKQQLTRTDAEFEADLFGITNGVTGAEPETAMDYFFSGVADIERRSSKPLSADYESATCRSGNVENIAAYLGLTPLLLVDAAIGGHGYFSRTSPSFDRAVIDKQMGEAPPGLKPGSCSHIAQVALGDMRAELKQLSDRIEPDLDFLFSTDKGLDVERARRLLGDLSEMAKNLRYMDGIAAKSVALLLRGWGLKGQNLKPLVANVDQLVDTPTVTAHFLNEDFGRLLQAQGLAKLQERSDMPTAARLDRSFSLLERAVTYNPAQSEAWMNLAMIAFKRGDCPSASRFAKQAVETNTDKEQVKTTQFFAGKMKEFSGDPETCRLAGNRFHPYDGL
jgi:hypothetical protein